MSDVAWPTIAILKTILNTDQKVATRRLRSIRRPQTPFTVQKITKDMPEWLLLLYLCPQCTILERYPTGRRRLAVSDIHLITDMPRPVR